jgi:hypothetical protein
MILEASYYDTMFRIAKLEYQLASDGKALMDIEEIRKELLKSLSETSDHKQLTRCFEVMTGYRTASSDERNTKWIYNG